MVGHPLNTGVLFEYGFGLSPVYLPPPLDENTGNLSLVPSPRDSNCFCHPSLSLKGAPQTHSLKGMIWKANGKRNHRANKGSEEWLLTWVLWFAELCVILKAGHMQFQPS